MWKIITFEFPRPLKLAEENELIAAIKTITERMREVIKGMLKGVYNPITKTVIKFSGAEKFSEPIANQLKTIYENIYDFAKLEKDEKSPNIYHFRVMENALRIVTPVSAANVNLWERFQKRLGLKFKLEMAKKFGFMPGEIKISYSEETDAPIAI